MTRFALIPGAWLAAGAVLLGALAHGLRPEAFFAGDQGVKLMAARAAIAHPSTPLNLPLPTIGGREAPDLLGTFYRAHGDHAHAATSPLFPILSAVPLRLFGLRGLSLLPALAWLLTLWLAAAVSRAIDRGQSAAWGVFVVAAATPLLFYALEFWEHLPAVALTTAATLAALRAEELPRRWALVGALTGAAFLLRPEALLYGLALVAVARPRPADVLRFVFGLGLVLLPPAAYNVAHFGSPIGLHLSSNAAGTLVGWRATRGSIAEGWFVDGAASALVVMALGVVIVRLGPRHSRGPRPLPVVAGTVLVLAATLWITTLAARRALPREGLWATFPLVGLSLLPLQSRAAVSHGVSRVEFLRRAALLFLALAWATAPNDGGAQWSPRYLLPACVPLGLLVSRGMRSLMHPRDWRWATVPCVAALLWGSLWIQRASYRDLRIAKSINARIVSAVHDQAGPARLVLSDFEWLDQLAAADSPPLTFLLADSTAVARSAMARLEAAGESPVLIVRRRADSRGGSAEDWLAGTCYRPESSGSLGDGALAFTRVSCRAASTSSAQRSPQERACAAPPIPSRISGRAGPPTRPQARRPAVASRRAC